jgi:hypothetical protein
VEPDTIVVGTLGFVGLWAAYHAWTVALRTMFRQQVFRLRDRLFLEAAHGRISFDDPAYGMLRTMLQKLLIAAEDINAIQIAVVVGAPRLRSDIPLSEKFQNNVNAMTDPAKAELYRRYFRSTLLLIATHIIRSFPVPILGAVVVAVLCRLPGKVWRTIFKRIQAAKMPAALKYLEGAYNLPDGAHLA